jgi:hypothetical protein
MSQIGPLPPIANAIYSSNSVDIRVGVSLLEQEWVLWIGQVFLLVDLTMRGELVGAGVGDLLCGVPIFFKSISSSVMTFASEKTVAIPDS